MKILRFIITLLTVLMCSCTGHRPGICTDVPQTIHIVSWGGIAADKADTLYSLAKECGFDMHLGLYRAQESAIASIAATASSENLIALISVILHLPFVWFVIFFRCFKRTAENPPLT